MVAVSHSLLPTGLGSGGEHHDESCASRANRLGADRSTEALGERLDDVEPEADAAFVVDAIDGAFALHELLEDRFGVRRETHTLVLDDQHDRPLVAVSADVDGST